MPEVPERIPQRLAAIKNAEAMRLVARGRLREALRALNDAIYSAPEYPHSYANRALVFERLGLNPQAESDRRRAQDLARSAGYAEDEVFAPPRLPAQRAAAAPRVHRTRTGRAATRRPGIAETAVVGVAILGLVATVVGIFLAMGNLDTTEINFDPFDFEAFRASEPDQATATATPEPTPEPTPPPVTPAPEVLNGNPYSFSTLEEAWKSKGLTVTVGAVNQGFTGFSVTPFDVTLSRGGASALVFVAIYRDRNGPSQEWNLSGSGPAPSGGRKAPAHERGWYNSNVIVLLRSGSPDVATQAKDAFLALGG
jgi:hypothetical protein